MKSYQSYLVKMLLVGALVVAPVQGSAGIASANAAYTDKLVMQKDSSILEYNGLKSEAVQPLTFKDGVSYAPFSSIAKLYGFQVAYDKQTKESIARSGELEIRFKPDSENVIVNGEIVKSSGKVFIQNGYMMIPLRTWANLTGSTLSLSDGQMSFTWNRVPKADFEVANTEIYATQTKLEIIDLAQPSQGRKIANERWEGLETYYAQEGTYTITRWVQDDAGTWSEPYSVIIHVRKANEPPVAQFTTNKTQYRMGEPVIYHENSYDDENSIVRRTWTGNVPVYFTPGDYMIMLEVEDRHGLTHSVSQKVTVTNETLYTEDEYNLIYTPIGDKMPINGSRVLSYEQVPYQVMSEQFTLARSNSPESLTEEGIVFYDQMQGNIRFLYHNQNNSNKNLSMYLVATNPNDHAARVGVTAFGMGGPNLYVSTGGKLAVSRYLTGLITASDNVYTTIQPGESKIITPEMSQVPLKPGLVMSAYTDLYTTSPIEFRVVVVDTGKDPVTEWPHLAFLDRDNKHVRGTFEGANRSLLINGTLGEKAQRITIGDRTMDKYLEGTDGIYGYKELNIGNFGVLYKMNVEVAPRTLIALNPRGGHYAGAFLINGKVVNATDKSILRNSSEAGILYRTGNSKETVEISFVLASGSNLPLQMLFLPLPELRY